jgi:hypothetical protein
VADQAAFFPGLGEGGVLDLVLVDGSQEDCEVIVVIWWLLDFCL